MPRMNELGLVAMGTGGLPGSIEQEIIPDSYGPQWLSNDLAIFAQPSSPTLAVYDIHTKERRVVALTGANDLVANSGVWAAWLDHRGLFSSTGLELPLAGLLDVGPDGAIGYVANRQEGVGADVIELNGEVWHLTDDIVYDLQLLGNKRAIWRNQHFQIRTRNIPPCTQIGGVWRPRALQIAGEWWACYFSSEAGVIFHPFNITVGYVIAPPGVDAFQHVLVQLGEITKLAWSSRAGEVPSDLRTMMINTFTAPRVELAPQDPIVPMNKDCWLTWFEFNGQLPGFTTPWNAQLKVSEGGPICKQNGFKFAQWVQGDSVESIENQIISIDGPVVVYWDGRNWPRWPGNLTKDDWLGLQAYCFNHESPAAFENAMRAIIESVPSSFSQIALICQCYTSNDSLTKNLKGLVPVYARLGRDYPRVNHLLVFSDRGRPTGLNDHPELVQPWFDLFLGITGEPQVPDRELPIQVWDVIVQMHDRFAQECIDAHPDDMEAAARMWTGRTNEQVLYSFPDQGYCWKSADPNRPPSKDSLARELNGFFGWDLLMASGANGPRDLVPYPPGVNDLTGQHPIHPGDPLAPGFEPRNWLGTEPSEISILVFEYTNPARRSDPLGCSIEFEIASPNPVTEIKFSINDGDLPFVWTHTPGTKDGRYFRALAFKVTVNGDWSLTISAKDSKGNEAVRVLPITVTF